MYTKKKGGENVNIIKRMLEPISDIAGPWGTIFFAVYWTFRFAVEFAGWLRKHRGGGK